MNAEARELQLYADNTSALYGQKQSIEKNLSIKMYKGTYSSALAPKLWMYWLEAAAKRYVKEFGGDVRTLFPKATREQAAVECAKDFEAEFKLGNFDRYKPKGIAKKEAAAKRSKR